MTRPICVALTALFVSLAATFLPGCRDNARLAEMAERAADRQAEQNAEMSRLNREVAESHRSLIEAESQSRTELVSLQQDLRADQAGINTQRDQLEADRKSIAVSRYWDSMVATVLNNVGLIVACLLPLILCVYLLSSVNDDTNDDNIIAEVLLEDLTSEKPTLLPTPRCTTPTQLGPTRKRLTADSTDAEEPPE